MAYSECRAFYSMMVATRLTVPTDTHTARGLYHVLSKYRTTSLEIDNNYVILSASIVPAAVLN